MLNWLTQMFWVFNRAAMVSFIFSQTQKLLCLQWVGSKSSSLEQMTEDCVSSFFPDLSLSSQTWAFLVWQLPHLSWFCGRLEAHWRPISSKEANVKPLSHNLACITAAGSVCGHHHRGAPLNINEQRSKRRQKWRQGKHKDRYAVWTNKSNQTSLVVQGECADEQ